MKKRSFFVVTNGDEVVGSFNTAAAAESWLRNSTHRLLSGEWVALKDAGFYISIRS
jgi:hypothetical protein